MKAIFNRLLVGLFSVFLFSSCLYHNLEELENSSDKDMTNVNYSYRFLYNDTIKKGTVNEEIQKDRVCEVIFNKTLEKTEQGGLTHFKATLTHNVNCVQKGGPSGSVTKQMLYDMFTKKITQDGLSSLWVYVSISDAATVTPLDGAPKLGTPGDFSANRTYRATAADGSYADYVLETIKGF